MLGLMMLGAIILYFTIAFKTTLYVMNTAKKTRDVVLTILLFILIPTWDVILGYPVYWYLCKYESGIKIYKTVDNVEGFYIGEKSKQFEPYYPYKGYKYIDYKETETGKYYRSYPLDNNTSKLCVPPSEIYKYGDYNKGFSEGRCVAKQEIGDGEVSSWEYHFESIKKSEIPILGIKQMRLAYVEDRALKTTIAESYYCWWRGGFIGGFFLTGSGANFAPKGFICDNENLREYHFLNATLKQKQGVSNGNN